MKSWEENLKLADDRTTNADKNALKRKLEEEQKSENVSETDIILGNCFGDLTKRIVSSLVSNGIDDTITEGIARSIQEMSSAAHSDRQLRGYFRR